MTQEILLKRIEELEKQNAELKKKLKNKNKRQRIKTKIKDIVNYWEAIEDECELSVDWSEASTRCWRCGYKTRLQKCHIIPYSLGGPDEPSNLVLLCSRCHIDAPNVESKTFMWDWIRANGTPFYDTFWKLRAQKEYEFIYKKTFLQELEDRDILSDYDKELFWNLKIGRSCTHFAHPWKNESTEAGLLRMRLEKFDEIHLNKKKKSNSFREKEDKFNELVCQVCEVAAKYNFNIWEGRSKNKFSITISSIIDRDKSLHLSIKLCKDGMYRACFTSECNPNNNKASEYTIELGEQKDVIEFITQEIEKFILKFGMPEKQEYVFTIDPICRLQYIK